MWDPVKRTDKRQKEVLKESHSAADFPNKFCKRFPLAFFTTFMEDAFFQGKTRTVN